MDLTAPQKNLSDENSLIRNGKQSSVPSSPSGHPSHIPLNDINNTPPNPKSLETAQRKWIEESKSWPVKDELQNAQLSWLRDFSSGVYGKALCSSTPQPKKKPPVKGWNLPFSPPKSSAEDRPRRGVCVYIPGLPSSSGTDRGNSVKIAKVEEPVKVAPVRKSLGDVEVKQSVPPVRRSLDEGGQSVFSPFPQANLKEIKKSPRKKHITLRKRLERLNPPQPVAPSDGLQNKQELKPTLGGPAATVPEDEGGETGRTGGGGREADEEEEKRREATRDYMLRKRLERERNQELERRKEALAEAERKARLERLRDTQLRIIKCTLKRQSFEKKRTEERKESSDSEVETHCTPGPGWRSGSVEPQDMEAASQEMRSIGSRHSLQSARHSSASNTASQNDIVRLEENGEPPPVETDSVGGEREETQPMDDTHIAELLLDQNIPSHLKMSLLARLEEGCRSGKDSLPEILRYPEYQALLAGSQPQPPASLPAGPPPVLSTSSSSQLSLLDLIDGDKQYKYPALSSHSIAESLEGAKIFQENETKRGGVRTVPSLSNFSSDNSHAHRDTERSYNISRAVANKHAALREFSAGSLNNDRDRFPSSRSFYNSHSSTIIQNEDLKNKSFEKGIQCCVDEEFQQKLIGLEPEITNDRLKKPEMFLVPSRISDPGQFVTLRPQSSSGHRHNSEVLRRSDRIWDSIPPGSDSEFPLVRSESKKSLAAKKLLFEEAAAADRHVYLNSCEYNGKKTTVERTGDCLTLPSSYQLNTSGSKGNRNASLQPSSHPTGNISTSVIESPNLSSSRIEEEIRKLDIFNESITSVIEKKKSYTSDNETMVNNEPSRMLERSFTTSTVNNEENISLRKTHSSSSVDGSEEPSGASVTKYSLEVYIDLLKNEDSRSAQQLSLFKVKENAIRDKIVTEVSNLKSEIKKLKEAGNEEATKNLRKRIRGLVLKMESDLADLQRMRRNEREEYKKRRQQLVEKINLIRSQLKLPADQLQDIISKERSKLCTSSMDSKKSNVSERRGSECRVALLEKKKRELEHREALIAEKLAELENISQGKQRLEEGEKRIQELEARLKMAPTAQSTSCKKAGEGGGGDSGGGGRSLVERGTSPCRSRGEELAAAAGDRTLTAAAHSTGGGSYSDTFDLASSSSNHDRLDEKDARKMQAIKVPLSPLVTLKRRYSSGSDESILQSQTETQSEASDMEVRVMALTQQLKQRKAKLESLQREYKKSKKERLVAKEQSLLSQIQAYDMYIEKIKKELEQEKEPTNVKIVKPQIKQPKIVSDRRKSDTWLIQERKKSESESNTDPLFLSTDGISSKTLEKPKTSLLMSKETLLDSGSLDKFSLKPSVVLKTSLSDNVPVKSSSHERVFHGRVSQSSTESCESDTEKGRSHKESKINQDHLGQLVSGSILEEKKVKEIDETEKNIVARITDLTKETEDQKSVGSGSGSGPISSLELGGRSSQSSQLKTEVKVVSNSKGDEEITELPGSPDDQTAETLPPDSLSEEIESKLSEPTHKTEAIPEIFKKKATQLEIVSKSEITPELGGKISSERSANRISARGKESISEAFSEIIPKNAAKSEIDSQSEIPSDLEEVDSKISSQRGVISVSAHEKVSVSEAIPELINKKVTMSEIDSQSENEEIASEIPSERGLISVSAHERVFISETIPEIISKKMSDSESQSEILTERDETERIISSEPIIKRSTIVHQKGSISESIPEIIHENKTKSECDSQPEIPSEEEEVTSKISSETFINSGHEKRSITESINENTRQVPSVSLFEKLSSTEIPTENSGEGSEDIRTEMSNEMVPADVQEEISQVSPEMLDSIVTKSDVVPTEISQSARSYIYGSETSFLEEIKTRASSGSKEDDKSSVSEEIVVSHSQDSSYVSKTSKAIVPDEVEEEAKLEESVNEVDYLEVSDHIYHKLTDEDIKPDEPESLEATSELSASHESDAKTLTGEIEEVPLSENLKENESVSKSDEKSTFQERIGADDILLSGQDLTEDISDLSFPLPITKDKTPAKNSHEKPESSENIISEEASSHESDSHTIEPEPEEALTITVETAQNVHEKLESSENIITHESDDIEPTEEQSIMSEESRVPTDKFDQKCLSIESELEERTIFTENQEGNRSSMSIHEVSSINERSQLDLSETVPEEEFEVSKSFSESEVLHDSDIKSPLKELDLEEDSLDGSSLLQVPMTGGSPVLLQSKLYGGSEGGGRVEEVASGVAPGEDQDENISEASESEEKLSEEDVFSITSGQDTADQKTTGAPLIDALQREGESALDKVWRGLAEAAFEEAKDLVLSIYLRRIRSPTDSDKSLDFKPKVGDNGSEDWLEEKLLLDKAAEAEILRLQQLRIDKEIEELQQEEEARQFFYVRPIPDKPPPPYTPRRSSLVGSVLEAASLIYREGVRELPGSFTGGSPGLREFIWDLAAELVAKACPPPPASGPPPPWVRQRRPRPRKPIRCLEDLLEVVEKEARIYLGVEERQSRENLIIRWSRKRRDHVDEILVRESGEEEAEWTDFSTEENIIKNRLAEGLIEESLTEACAALAGAFQRKFTEEGVSSRGETQLSS